MTTTEASKPRKFRTVTLSAKPPVRVREDLWPVIAWARRHDGEIFECQANHFWHLTVRQHADGRVLVYGSEERGNGGVHPGYEPAYAGELLQPGEDVASAIIRVGEGARCSKAMQDKCIADLPAVEIVMPIDGALRMLRILDECGASSFVDPGHAKDLRAIADELRAVIDLDEASGAATRDRRPGQRAGNWSWLRARKTA